MQPKYGLDWPKDIPDELSNIMAALIGLFDFMKTTDRFFK